MRAEIISGVPREGCVISRQRARQRTRRVSTRHQMRNAPGASSSDIAARRHERTFLAAVLSEGETSAALTGLQALPAARRFPPPPQAETQSHARHRGRQNASGRASSECSAQPCSFSAQPRSPVFLLDRFLHDSAGVQSWESAEIGGCKPHVPESCRVMAAAVRENAYNRAAALQNDVQVQSPALG
jgi:hypothetical protein